MSAHRKRWLCRLIGHRWVEATGHVHYHLGVRCSHWSDPRISRTGYPNGYGCLRCWRFKPRAASVLANPQEPSDD